MTGRQDLVVADSEWGRFIELLYRIVDTAQDKISKFE
jgi:hypothetical protein